MSMIRASTLLYAATASGAAFTGWRYLAFGTGSPHKVTMMSTAATVRTRTGGFPSKWLYKSSHFQRMDESADGDFYVMPRFVTHSFVAAPVEDLDTATEMITITQSTIAVSTASPVRYYMDNLPSPASAERPAKPKILDIASSWISHLPEDWLPSNYEVIGIGMNKAELSKNRALSRHLVVDLNEHPDGLSAALQSEKGSYEAAICSVSIDYMTSPRELLADIHGLLKKGGSVHCAFSNRCFPTKVVGLWLNLNEEERCDMVADYFHFAGTMTSATGNSRGGPGELYDNIEIVTVLPKSRSGDPLYVVRAQTK